MNPLTVPLFNSSTKLNTNLKNKKDREMLSRIEQNSVQQFSALNAFKSNKNILPKQEEAEQVEVSRGTETSSAKTLLDRIDVNDVRECAKSVGEFNISDDDIKYGLLYGRSVIAEFLC